jgi:large subunit ribosomal protein L23
VESIFNVKVLSVHTVSQKGKTKRMGRNLGKRNDWKKAYVTLAPGQSVEFFEGA